MVDFKEVPMAIRHWRDHLVTLITDVPVFRRQREVVLWRLCQTSGTTETTCSFTEPAPEIFHVLVTCDGRTEVRRQMRGINTLMSWSENLNARLRAAGWHEVDQPEGSHGVRDGRARSARPRLTARQVQR
jgi:hypothetical protein